jgi:hypothetical protein
MVASERWRERMISINKYKQDIFAIGGCKMQNLIGSYLIFYMADREWLKMYKNNKHPKSDKMPLLTWEERGNKQLVKIIKVNL